MILSENHSRRVRIIGKSDDTTGYGIAIQDAETGEKIDHVFGAVITLQATGLNVVELTYYEADKESGNIIAGEDDKPVVKTVCIKDPEVDVTAYEI
jgi:hypothetical protein